MVGVLLGVDCFLGVCSRSLLRMIRYPSSLPSRSMAEGSVAGRVPPPPPDLFSLSPPRVYPDRDLVLNLSRDIASGWVRGGGRTVCSCALAALLIPLGHLGPKHRMTILGWL